MTSLGFSFAGHVCSRQASSAGLVSRVQRPDVGSGAGVAGPSLSAALRASYWAVRLAHAIRGERWAGGNEPEGPVSTVRQFVFLERFPEVQTAFRQGQPDTRARESTSLNVRAFTPRVE